MIVHIIHIAFCKVVVILYYIDMAYESYDALEMQPRQLGKMPDAPRSITTYSRG